uniref:Uncharacterized protein n=1 Tax=Rhizophora mucronata TaxID=61149 RepID=A0A2P2Q5A5_RHIMU
MITKQPMTKKPKIEKKTNNSSIASSCVALSCWLEINNRESSWRKESRNFVCRSFCFQLVSWFLQCFQRR